VLRTYRADEFALADLLARKIDGGVTTSLVLPARNEAATVAAVLGAYLPLRDVGFLDEIVVVDSASTDETASVASAAGATVVVADQRGKGEALWQGLRATTGDLVAYADADVLDARGDYVTGLFGPMLTSPDVQLVKGFYRRPIVGFDGIVEEHGGRVTELTARPLLSIARPELAQFIQPLAGEYAGRRSLLASLSYPMGYGVEIAVLLDTHAAIGMDGMAQCDLGVRTHRHQSQQALGVMAAEVLTAALRRLGLDLAGDGRMHQFSVDDHSVIDTPLLVSERGPLSPR
jgi:glucosyl-3-phosphoglycerate synthase